MGGGLIDTFVIVTEVVVVDCVFLKFSASKHNYVYVNVNTNNTQLNAKQSFDTK